MTLSMDISVSFLKCELASTIDQAVRCAVEAVLKETARVVGVKMADARNAAAESHRENQTLRERLEVSESELKAVRYYLTAAERNIKQCLLLNRNQSVLNPARPSRGDGLFTLSPRAADASPTATLTGGREFSHKTFRNTAGRLNSPKTLPSVGLCLPTIQTDWPREGVNRRKARGSSVGIGPVFTNDAGSTQTFEDTSPSHVILEEPTEGPFYISSDRDNSSGTTDAEQVHEETKASGPFANPPEDPSEMPKFEFEMSATAGNVSELDLIQVMEDTPESKQCTIKIEIEDYPDSQNLEPPSSNTMQELPQLSSPPVAESDTDSAMAPPAVNELRLSRTGESPDKVHRCNVCGRGFRRFYCLKTHQRIHTGERPYPCRFCEKRFRHLDSLHKHQRIHTGERPYRCAECGCCFRELGQLKKHRLKHSPSFSPVANPNLSLLPGGPSYAWSRLNSQSLDSM
ncbi:hypothetical protein DNTS_032198 [Danionella cerebrum]|uniref:C2H2-type domain-containing protein n=1 Tax=Danionella cerebrum TaxID=2873325 RepID=A0A553R3H2_9TELE|nr:hypothetical protein DNTS_032198 [Danionella translucida]TRY96714.1 hypothetical protein DNTS_032198 [Danionella translucida]